MARPAYLSCARLPGVAELGLAATAAERVALERRGALLITALEGDALSLGRHQPRDRLRAAPDSAARLRRWTGGRSSFYGDGIVSVCALVPDRDAWLDEPAPLQRLLNRYVRGLVRSIHGLAYPGRDFLTLGGRRVGYLTAECDARAVVLVQAILSLGASGVVPQDDPQRAGLPAPPPPGCLDGWTVERLESALVEGFRSRFDLDLEPLDVDAIPRTPPDPEVRGLVEGDEVDVPIGRIGAHVALSASGALARVRLLGDWIADSPGVAALESALVGLAPTAESLAPVCEAHLRNPDHLTLGVVGTGALVRAIENAAHRIAPRDG